jgi:hypothetical protein
MVPASHRSSVAPRRLSIPPSAHTSSRPPMSRPLALPPASIRSQLSSEAPSIVLVEFAGRIGLPDILASRDFGNIVKALGGKPFRVLCDFTQTITMPAEVCAVFARGQEFAVARGMERDAFVCTSSVLRLQFARIARESGRIGSLGPLRFFDSLDDGRAYLAR